MIYIIKNNNGVLQNVMNDLGNLNPHKDWQVEIKIWTKNRTLPQNALMWKWIQIIGDDLGYTSEELHEAFKSKFLGIEKRKTIFGKEYETLNSTTELTTKEFSEYMDKIQAFAMMHDITLPQPDYYGLGQS